MSEEKPVPPASLVAPGTQASEFLADMVTFFVHMVNTVEDPDDVGNEGYILQEEMKAKYPKEWVEWLLENSDEFV